jgi:Uma2 family endonuclease
MGAGEVGSVGVQIKRWTREQYDALVRHGVLGEDDRVQLIEGEIVEMAPQGPPHMTAISLVAETLREAFGEGYHCRVQGPLALSTDSEPEPDVAVVRGNPRDFAREHPAVADLVVEVADTTGDFDRHRKGPMYAAAGIQEYWVVDVGARIVDVYRDPHLRADGSAGYRIHQRMDIEVELTPLAATGRPIPVREILP